MCRVSATSSLGLAGQSICRVIGNPTGKAISVSRRIPLLDMFTLRPVPAEVARFPRNRYETCVKTGYRRSERRLDCWLSSGDEGSDSIDDR